MTDTTNAPHNLSAIDFLRTRSLANVVQAEIERMIIDGELKPNERVNENGLSQRLGVSRGPIREACSALAAMGLIEIIPNRGFFIRALTNDEAQDLSEARAGVFGCMAMMLAERITDAQIAILQSAVGDAWTRSSNLATSIFTIQSIWSSTSRLTHMAGNNRLELIYQSFVRELHIQRYRALSSQGRVAYLQSKSTAPLSMPLRHATLSAA